MRIALLKHLTAALSVMLLLGACTTVEPIEESGTDETAALSDAAADDIIIHLDYEPTFSMPETMQPFGRVPDFTLYGDGRVFYVEETVTEEGFSQRFVTAQLTSEEAAALLQEVQGAGFAELESYTDMCRAREDGMEECIADASISVLSVWSAPGETRTIRNYAGFANNPEDLRTIETLLRDYTHPEAALYIPEQATLWVTEGITPEGDPLAWPLDAALLEVPDDTPDFGGYPRVLSGDQVPALIDALGNNMVLFAPVEQDGSTYGIQLTPWLPTDDYTDAINTWVTPGG